jgi:hypothetical protein
LNLYQHAWFGEARYRNESARRKLSIGKYFFADGRKAIPITNVDYEYGHRHEIGQSGASFG